MALKLASLLCTCIINVVSKRDVHGSRNMFVSESCCRALGRPGTGCWCEACKHLKRDFRKAGYFCLQITGLWSTEFSSFSQGDAQFQSSICMWNIPITLFHVFILHLIVPHQHKPQNFLQLFSLPKCHWISAISLFSFSFVQVSAVWCARLNEDSQLSAFWPQESHPCRESEITGMLPEPLPTSFSESPTTSLLSLMDLPSGHTA